MVKPGLRYGGLAFLAGAVLGPVREVLLAPLIGGLAAAWIEAAAMAPLLWVAAAASLDRRQGDLARFGAGLLALAVVVAAEAALSAVLVLSGLAANRLPRSAAEQAPGLLLMAWLVAIPLLQRRPA